MSERKWSCEDLSRSCLLFCLFFDCRTETCFQMKAVHLHHDLFSIENDLITPTLKNKRPQLKKRFSEELDAMYAKLAS